MANRHVFLAFILIITILPLSGCLTLPDPETSQESNREVISVEYKEGITVGQTFISRRAHLNGLTFWINRNVPPETGLAWVTVRLFLSPEEAAQSAQPIFNNHISVAGSGPVNFSLPVNSEPAGQGYYLELTPSDASLLFLGQNVDAYGGGTAYVNGVPIPGDLAFHSTYRFTPEAAISDLLNMAAESWLLLPLMLVLLSPGWLLLDLSGLRRRFDGGEQVALSLGLSLSVISLLMLWSSTLGLHWSREVLVVAGVLLVLATLWRFLRQPCFPSLNWPGLLLVGIFFAALVVRLMMVRDLVAPAWVDPVHHALITNLIIDTGALPSSYAPYLQLNSTVYHTGYHSTLAAFQWLSDLDLPQGMLLYGQVLNAACVFAVYLLTTRLTGDRRAGIWAALMCGLLTPMPAYYVSWGRYTQLAGLLILPLPLAFFKLIFEYSSVSYKDDAAVLVEGLRNDFDLDEKFSSGPKHIMVKPFSSACWLIPFSLACLSAAGLLLVHYRAAAFLACLLAAYSINLFLGSHRLARPELSAFIWQLLVSGSLLIFGTLLLTWPWMAEIFRDRLLPAFSLGKVVPAEPFADFSWRFLDAGSGAFTLWMAGLGILLGLLLRKRFIVVVLLWIGFLFLLSNLGAMGLPGGWIINNTSVAITLFMPISLLGGYAFCSIATGGEWLLRRRSNSARFVSPFRFAQILIGIAISFAGAWQLFPLLNQSTYLFRAADRPAIAWIEKNILQDEVILINPFSWGYGLCAGNDGGAWISALSGQPTMPPPVIYGFGDRIEMGRVNTLCAQVMQHGGNPDELWALMQEAGIRYIYLGVRGGPISPTNLLSSPLFDTLYAEGGAYVFKTLGW
jgi:hypothetical protein